MLEFGRGPGCQVIYAEALAETAGPDAGLAHAERVRAHLEKNKVPPKHPHWEEHHHSLGLILEKAGRLEEAAEALRKTRMINRMELDLERIEEKLRKRDSAR